MNLRFFIDRPVFSGVISVVIVLMGLIAIKVLPVEQYPDIAPPTVNVFCTYPGANAETVQKAVIVPLEEAINGVEDMIYMTSTASNTGDASINIYFKQGANADMAAVNVQNRVNGALSQLPAEAPKRRHDRETAECRADDFRALLTRRPFRPDFPEQLHENQCRATGETYRRCRKGTAVRLELQYAFVAQTGQDGGVRAYPG